MPPVRDARATVAERVATIHGVDRLGEAWLAAHDVLSATRSAERRPQRRTLERLAREVGEVLASRTVEASEEEPSDWQTDAINQPAHAVASRSDLVERLRRGVDALPERERSVLRMRWGLDPDEEPARLIECARLLGRTTERTRQICLAAERRLYAHCAKTGLRSCLDPDPDDLHATMHGPDASGRRIAIRHADAAATLQRYDAQALRAFAADRHLESLSRFSNAQRPLDRLRETRRRRRVFDELHWNEPDIHRRQHEAEMRGRADRTAEGDERARQALVSLRRSRDEAVAAMTAIARRTLAVVGIVDVSVQATTTDDLHHHDPSFLIVVSSPHDPRCSTAVLGGERLRRREWTPTHPFRLVADVRRLLSAQAIAEPEGRGRT